MNCDKRKAGRERCGLWEVCRAAGLPDHTRNATRFQDAGDYVHLHPLQRARRARPLLRSTTDRRARRASVPHGFVGGVDEGLHGMLGVHVAHFRPMCLTARNSPRHPTSPILSRTGPTRFDRPPADPN